MSELEELRQRAILSSLAGFSFLFVMGVAWLVGGVLSYWVPDSFALWIYPCLGGAAMPIAITLERRLGYCPVPNPDPLLPLTLQLLFVQIVAFPAILLVWGSTPHFTPVAFAAIVGAHFLPFQWVYRTRTYLVLGIVVAVGPFVLAVMVGALALHYTGFFVGSSLLVGSLFVRAHARATWRASGLAASPTG
jgi:hypothetical protein